ncbi:MAG: chromosomal replication initiator protein DnaA [Dehalococcoidia bacterium]|nr:chromosomal replication initiator protein DnaA [Dehalococcoidia bacterium]
MTMDTPAAIWDATLGQLQLEVTRANYDTWLRDTIALRHDDDGFVIAAPNDFAREWLSMRLRPMIARALARVLGHKVDVVFEVLREPPAPPPALLEAAEDVVPEQYRKRVMPPPALNPLQTFGTFVVGEENRLAADAAARVVEQPGAMNPLLLFGASGLGKTHLLNAIGHAGYERGLSVIYASAERFGNDYVKALSTNIDAFRARYRGAGVLLIDDIQFLEGKEKFQEEFFHTFNELQAAGHQIVVSADRAPSQLRLNEGIRSRLQSGLSADIRYPGFETRLAILRAKALRQPLRLGEDVLRMIAERCCPSVRELEGSLNRVIAYLPLIGGVATPAAVAQALSPLAATPSREAEPPSAEAIVAAVCRRTAMQARDLSGKSRSRDVTYARHMAMYVLREDGHRTVAEIGRLFGNRDHSTVLGGIQRIAGELATRAETGADLAAIRASLAPEAAAAAAARAG